MSRPAARRFCTVRMALAGLASLALTQAGCYEKVIRVKQGPTTTEVAKPDFDEQPGALDELMWGPVPAGQDPAKYYAKKKRLMAQ